MSRQVHLYDNKILEHCVEPKTRADLVKLTKGARSTLFDALIRLGLDGKIKSFSDRPQGPGRPKVFFQTVEIIKN